MKKKFSILSFIFFAIFITACDRSSDFSDVNVSTIDSSSVDFVSEIQEHYILFAHGFMSNAKTWDDYVNNLALCDNNEAEDNICYRVIRTDVAPMGSIQERATQLAAYIYENYDDKLEEGSLLAVGHSMGGLDLHYIISKGHEIESKQENDEKHFYALAKKIEKIYTIATPHKGNQFSGDILESLIDAYAIANQSPTLIVLADLLQSSAIHDMGLREMQAFNEKYPYTTFSIKSRKIPLYALRFKHNETAPSDFVVALKNQSFNGAKHLQDPIVGSHVSVFLSDATPELKNITLLHAIVDNANGIKGDEDTFYYDTEISDIPYKNFDIIMYEGNSCTQDEVGLFSSHDLPGIIECGYNVDSNYENRCANDEMRSMKLLPGVAQNLLLKFYNNKDGSYSDDVTRIHLGDINISEAFCINSFEEETTDSERNHQITKTYFRRDGIVGNGIDGKISRVNLRDSQLKYDTHNIIFYNESSCKGSVTGLYKSRNKSDEECSEFGGDKCQNDTIVSLKLLPGVDKEIVIKLFNDPDGTLNDDWTRIHLGDTTLSEPLCIDGFESTATDTMQEKNITMEYFPNDNGIGDGLNGKISHIYIAHSDLEYDPHDIIFYEGDSCSGNVVGLFKSKNEYNVDCKDSDLCSNDKIHSLRIDPTVEENTIIKVYNSPEGYKDDDWSRIHIGVVNFDEPFCLKGFEHQTSTLDASHNISISHHAVDAGFGDGLNGKISHIYIAKSTDKNDPDDLIFYSDKFCHSSISGVFQSHSEYLSIDCKESERCKNDSAKSLLIYPGAKHNVALRIYDSPEADRGDDWATIYRHSKELRKPFCINSFEADVKNINDADTDITIYFHPNNGLNGKVSRIEIGDASEF